MAFSVQFFLNKKRHKRNKNTNKIDKKLKNNNLKCYSIINRKVTLIESGLILLHYNTFLSFKIMSRLSLTKICITIFNFTAYSLTLYIYALLKFSKLTLKVSINSQLRLLLKHFHFLLITNKP